MDNCRFLAEHFFRQHIVFRIVGTEIFRHRRLRQLIVIRMNVEESEIAFLRAFQHVENLRLLRYRLKVKHKLFPHGLR